MLLFVTPRCCTSIFMGRERPSAAHASAAWADRRFFGLNLQLQMPSPGLGPGEMSCWHLRLESAALVSLDQPLPQHHPMLTCSLSSDHFAPLFMNTVGAADTGTYSGLLSTGNSTF